MKNLLLPAFLFLLTINVFAQYPEVTIREIQYQDPGSLITYFDDDMPSPYEGDTVTVTGIVMVSPYMDQNPANGVIMYVGGGAAGFYMQDTSETDWSGILVRMEDPISSDFEILDSGNVVKITGVVNEYISTTQKTTQFNVIEFTAANNLIDIRNQLEPVELTLDSLKEIGTNTDKAIAEKWEGVYVIVRDVSVFELTGSGGFRIWDDNNTQLNIGTKSNYYYQMTPPALNTRLEYVKGYIETRSVGSAGVTINPGYPEDVKIQALPPVVTDVSRDVILVGSGQPVMVSATITDEDGVITDAKLYYRENMGSSHNELQMNNTSGDLYQATIPAYNDSSLIDFFIRAVDDSLFVTLSPADTSSNRYFYMVLDRDLMVQDIQYSPFGSGFSGYNGYEVTVRGIVSVDTTDIEGTETGTILTEQVYIQNGAGPWSGINIFGTEPQQRRRGDDVSVTGIVVESFGVTQIGSISAPATIQLHTSGNPVPDPEPLSTAAINGFTNGDVRAEQWEGVLIKYENVTVTDENANGDPGPNVAGGNTNYGAILVMDASTVQTRVALQYGTHQYHNYWLEYLASYPNRIYEGDTFDAIAGVFWYGFGDYQLLPRKNDDFVGHTTNTENEIGLPAKYDLSQNYPNPFNPSTKIRYSLPVGGNVTLKVFNILGQDVMTLIHNEMISAGSHEVTFDASNLPSGIYLYRIISDGFVQVKKMILMK
jgi:hypothetical protein